jgi:hypothetical protein
MGCIKMQIRKIFRILFDKRAINNAVSATIMTSVVIALGLSVFTWAQARSSDYNSEFSETVDTETAKLREKLAFEYIFYDGQNLTVFLLNCGTIDDVKIKTVYIYDSGSAPIQIFSDPPLYPFHGWVVIPSQDLDIQDEGRLVLPFSPSPGVLYNIKIVTVRGAPFDTDFVA